MILAAKESLQLLFSDQPARLLEPGDRIEDHEIAVQILMGPNATRFEIIRPRPVFPECEVYWKTAWRIAGPGRVVLTEQYAEVGHFALVAYQGSYLFVPFSDLLQVDYAPFIDALQQAAQRTLSDRGPLMALMTLYRLFDERSGFPSVFPFGQ